MKFDPNQYETVKQRKERFYSDHSDGRIVVRLCNESNPLDYALFEARIYLTQEDQKSDIPRGVGYALEVRDKELSISNYGKEYESVNYSSWTENAEESAVGRALDNAGYSGNKKPSREEMEKAQRMNTTMRKKNVDKRVEKYSEHMCDYHKVEMTKKRSKKTGKEFYAHVDDEKGFCFGKGYKHEIQAHQDKMAAERVADDAAEVL